MESYSSLVVPGTLEIYCGPMNCGKTTQLIHRLDQVKRTNIKTLILKPSTDTRHDTLQSSFTKIAIPYNGIIDPNNPSEILEHINSEKLVVLDEIQFYKTGIESVVETLQRKGSHILAGGLDNDFRGEGFGRMPQLLAMAHKIHKLVAVCDYKDCSSTNATRTQKLINGEPAPYVNDKEIISVEGTTKNETYESRCLKHHFVPGKPK